VAADGDLEGVRLGLVCGFGGVGLCLGSVRAELEGRGMQRRGRKKRLVRG
jgi:hypothetical protein